MTDDLEGVLFRARKEWGQGVRFFQLIFSTIVTVVLLYALIFMTDKWQQAFVIVFGLAFSTPTCVFQSLKMPPQEIIMRRDSVELYKNGRLKLAIEYGPSVLAGLFTDRRTKDLDFGPLEAIVLCHRKKCVICDQRMGWSIADVRKMWHPFLKVVREHGMEVDKPLQRYIERWESGTLHEYYT